MSAVVEGCQFCGHEDVEIDEVGCAEFAVCCPECRAIGPICGDVMSSIKAWNTGFVVALTPAGGGDISPAASAADPSLRQSTTAAGLAVDEPPKPDQMPAEARSDEINVEELFDILGKEYPDPPPTRSDELAFRQSRRLVCSASTDGSTTIHRFGTAGIVLTREETRSVYEFLSDSARVWAKEAA